MNSGVWLSAFGRAGTSVGWRERVFVFSESDIGEHIRALETHLLDPAVRASREKLDQLIAADFVEFASSGRILDKAEVIASLQAQPRISFTLCDFEARLLSSGIVLATYHAVLQTPAAPIEVW